MKKISWRWETSLAGIGIEDEGVLYIEDDASEEEICEAIREAVDFEANFYYHEESLDTLD